MITDQQKQLVLLIALCDTDILAIEIVAIEVAASSHTLFCCRIGRASGHSGVRFKVKLSLFTSKHPHTNKQLTQPFFYLTFSFLWNEEDGCFILLPDHWKKQYLQCSSTLPQSRLRGGANGRSLKLLEFICVSKLHCSSENAKYCQFQRGKKLSSPQYAWFSSTGSKYLEPARAENRNIILYSTLAFKSC